MPQGGQHAHDAFGARGGGRAAERVHAPRGRHRHHGDTPQPDREAPQDGRGREGAAAAGPQAGPEAPAQEQPLAGGQPGQGPAVAAALRTALQRQDRHVGRLLLGHGEAGVRDHRRVREAHQSATVRGALALSVLLSDAQGEECGGQGCLRAGICLSRHCVQSHDISHNGFASSLHVW